MTEFLFPISILAVVAGAPVLLVWGIVTLTERERAGRARSNDFTSVSKSELLYRSATAAVICILISRPILVSLFVGLHALIGKGDPSIGADVGIMWVALGGKSGVPTFLIAFVSLFPWVAFFVMAIGWIRNRPIHLVWPALGTLSAIYALSKLLFLSIYALPGVIFAIWLVRFHIKLRGTRHAAL